MKYLEILVYQLAIYFIRKGWGADCETWDYDDYNGVYDVKHPEARCPSCYAKSVIIFLEENIKAAKQGF